jgi:formylglycine-generating enzyme required for sulfatase activity
MPRPLKVFLCHAHSDKDTVKALYARLKREGVDVWLDKEKLLPGADWEYEIRKAVRESDVVIVCLSKQFNQAGFRQKEVRIALEEADKKPEGEIFIIPARLEECDNLDSLSRWHWVDLFEGDGFQRLILALRIRADKIGAALRQRGATISRPKKDPEQQDAEKERIEQARREAEEQERQRLAKEQADREDAEKAERERLAREAEEKAARERLAREAAEKATREKEERETAERLAREQSEREAKEQAEREAAEKAAREKAEREKQKRGMVGKESARRQIDTPTPKLNLRSLSIGGIIFACLLLAVFGGDYLINNINSTETETPAQATVAVTKTLTPAPTKTFTPAPPTFTPTPGIGSTKDGEDGMMLVFVPEGEFTMGEGSDEHQVILDAFWIDQTEVTNAMYAKCVTDGDCTLPESNSSDTHDDYYGNSEFNNYPVINVNWEQANTYCSWAGRELPSEAEWEKAARGEDGNIYPWGNTFDGTILNFCDANCIYDWANKEFNDGYADVSPVGNYPSGQSPYGALDMAGNVWEWVSDWYDVYPGGDANASSDFGETYRVLRGGSWNNNDGNVRSANRGWDDPAYSDNLVGFRCSLSHP